VGLYGRRVIIMFSNWVLSEGFLEIGLETFMGLMGVLQLLDDPSFEVY